MALKATIYKANVNIADMDRHHYQDAALTLAQHPSETEQRMMLRLLAWCCHADERLTFTKGLCADDEPELWLRNDYNGVDLWIELGLPDEKRLKKACSLSRQVVLYAYSERAARVWWQQNQARLATLRPLSIYFIDDEALSQLAALATRTMDLQVTRQEGQLWVSDPAHSVEIALDVWQQGSV
ncbi:YaeQ family protein [Edwardsiella piscicida]|uniref:YaeQ n=3 Tax=Edwardsiella TaxID=635 RepID=A0A0H3DNL3_EDWTF|nr:YaeQ family protein [Edwardsiella piscicida]ACY83609.1 conserved hypothetical protein [Edwardsiella tarda EIB202]ADM40829.1 YaeQ [Edwardsiella tarda FL6-60]AGH72870.1 YaeQ protein [Edwardsiella piscicida C07-087]AOP44714.1 YaeQ family protein [Edwardsiella piscicida]ARD17608.1 hypothetical protein BXA22_04275 [Edwardsiella piscicida]